MTIALTTPHIYDPGHGDAPEVSNEIKIVDFHMSIVESCLTIITQYGNTSEDVWIAGNAPGHDITIKNTPAQIHPDDPEQSIPADPSYNILVGTSMTSATGVPIYGEVSDSLYQYLIDKGHYIGTIT